MKPSSAVRRGTCTRPNGSARFADAALKGKRLLQRSWNAAARFAAKVVEDRRKPALQALVRENVEAGANLYSDALKSYDGLGEDFEHQVIDHAVEDVNGQIHTNGIENFWSLLKRGLKGTYASVEPFHLFRYLYEQALRYNERKHETGDGGRFDEVLRTAVGRRLREKELTGKTEEAPTAATA